MLKKSILSLLLFCMTAVAQVANSRPYPIDNNHSTVGFSVPILGGLSQVKGKFTDFTITLKTTKRTLPSRRSMWSSRLQA